MSGHSCREQVSPPPRLRWRRFQDIGKETQRVDWGRRTARGARLFQLKLDGVSDAMQGRRHGQF